MLRPLLLLTFCAAAFCQCRTLHVSDFHAQNSRVAEPLPRLGLLVHQESFSAAFDRETFDKGWNGNVAAYRNPSPGDLYVLSDLPLEDVFSLLGNEISDNLAEQKGARYGHVRFRLVNYDRRTPGWGWNIPSALSLGTLNVLGMPRTRVSAELELQVEVADANKKVLARYRAPGAGQAYVALYYGYRHGDAWRKANLLALKDAMASIRTKMAADLPDLRAQLLAGGPLK
jgi:hypothetical protein